MRYFLLRQVQKIVRASLKAKLSENVAWRAVPHIRNLFGAGSEEDKFLTIFDHNLRMWVSLSNHIESQIFWQEVQEADRGQVRLLKSLLAPDHVFFDIGANVGVYSLLAAKRLSAGKVHAFEPSSIHCKKFQENMDLNGFQNVLLNQLALSTGYSEKKLYVPTGKNTGMASLYKYQDSYKEVEEEDVYATSLDGYVQANSVGRVDLIKIDVEGAESEVLKGSLEVLGHYRPTVMMEADCTHLARAGRTPSQLIDFWKELGYAVYRIGSSAELTRIESSSDFLQSQNIYCCPEEAA